MSPAARLKVVHLATFDTHGGAAVAALRLIDGQRRRGHDARLLVREKATAFRHVEPLGGARSKPPQALTDPDLSHFAWLLTTKARSAVSDAPFSTDLPTFDVASQAIVQAADVLHLHWVTGFLSAYEIGQLQRLGKPMVWTLHDQAPFTGGCHYSRGCEGYARGCERCPQLLPPAQPLASRTLAQKHDFIDASRLVVAAPSRWLAKCARESLVFRGARVEVVPYGIDVAASTRTPRADARRALGLADDALVVFIASINNVETRKGDAHLAEAIRRLRTTPGLLAPARRRRLRLLTAGFGARDVDVHGVPCQSIGNVAFDDPRLAAAYRAADVFVLPTLEDNLPNTLLESMAAGTPVVAYRTGGVPDVIVDKVNGRVVRRGDVAALTRALASVLTDDAGRERLGRAAEDLARTAFDLPVQVAAYDRIYADAPRRSRAKARAASARRRVVPRTTLKDAPRLTALRHEPEMVRLFIELLRRDLDELQTVVASRGGALRDFRAAAARAEQALAEQQAVIDARGGEIRDLRRDVATLTANAAEMHAVIQARGGAIRDLERDLGDAEAAMADARLVAEARHEWLRRLLRTTPARAAQAPNRPTIGIFGTGEGGLRVFDVAIVLDCAVAWFCDNNPATHGRTQGGLPVIAPVQIPEHACDLIVIGSAHRDAIRAQLAALGVAPARILAPDVSRPISDLVDELRGPLTRG